MRTLDRCIPLALAAGVLAAQPLIAQETQPTTHTVVKGDNLWDLSQKYLGNAFLWPEIYRLNRDVVEDPHWIYPGEVLRLPGAGPVVAEQPPTEAPTTAAPTNVSPVNPEQPTVFGKTQTSGMISSGGVLTDTTTVNAAPPPTVRAGEVIAAPYVDREGGPRGFGRILKTGEIAGIAEHSERYRFQAYDKIFIDPPPGMVAPEGERYLAYKLGPVLENQGQVIIPTGIVEVTRAARSDVAAVAKVVKAFNELTASDRLIPIDTLGVTTTVRPVRITNGARSEIKWIYGEPVLPSVQNFVVLGLSSQEGVKMGDEVLIFLPQTKRDRGQPADPEIPISKAQVVRSTPYGVTAVIVGQEQPAVKEGMAARIIARMP
ncbi:MAG TPA: LysM peptidoglycan-binding domain-containing protein [Gemmatimonadaceae bacterium]|nr:LysM peptidoglycan-binding domain-containing protein [Gemmatimonadaceae bacterium]